MFSRSGHAADPEIQSVLFFSVLFSTGNLERAPDGARQRDGRAGGAPSAPLRDGGRLRRPFGTELGAGLCQRRSPRIWVISNFWEEGNLRKRWARETKSVNSLFKR